MWEERWVPIRHKQIAELLIGEGHSAEAVEANSPAILRAIYNELRERRAMRHIALEGEYRDRKGGGKEPTAIARYLTDLQSKSELSFERMGLSFSAILKLRQTGPSNLESLAGVLLRAEQRRQTAIEGEFTQIPEGEEGDGDAGGAGPTD